MPADIDALPTRFECIECGEEILVDVPSKATEAVTAHYVEAHDLG